MRSRRCAAISLIFALAFSMPAVAQVTLTSDQSDIWWNGAESGWGTQVVQEGDASFATLYVYDSQGQPTFFSATLAADSPSSWSGDLYALLIQLPLGTYTGWNPIASGPLKGREASLSAGYIPFAKTKADRIASNDPRPSIEERYSGVWDYYFRAIGIANALVLQRYLLPDDANVLINQLLNNIVASGLLPKRGSFAPGMEPKALLMKPSQFVPSDEPAPAF
jgi:hypothetical protein